MSDNGDDLTSTADGFDAIRARQFTGAEDVVHQTCHDITAFPALGLAAGACQGNGVLLDISDPANPVRLDAVSDPNFSYWHSATFSNDGKKVIFTDEWGGGTSARCRATDQPQWGADAIWGATPVNRETAVGDCDRVRVDVDDPGERVGVAGRRPSPRREARLQWVTGIGSVLPVDLGISGRVAIVCASTAGLGEATAKALAAEGVRVVVCGRRRKLAEKIAADLPEAIGLEVDLTAPDGPASLVKAATDAFGPVDILVLNGPGPRPGGSVDISDHDIEASLGPLLLAHQRLVSLVLPGMREQGWGRILALASIGVVAPIPSLALSNIGRAALGAYMKTLATEVAGDGVTVNLLLPGRISTERTMELAAYRAEREGISVEEMTARTEGAIPVGRFGRPAELGAVAAFLCSAAASYVTGTATRCDGGAVPSL
jgi:3-oxoacyl-[acyl-carrier protein] reductase